MDEESIKQELLARVVDGKITCSEALTIAQTFRVDSKDVGAMCNELDIKITACQLGCFE